MKNKLFFLIIFVSLFLFAYSYAVENPITTINSNTENLLLQFELGEYYIDHLNNYTFINGANLSFDCMEGEAKLPVYIFIVGIPPQGNVSFTTFESKTSEINLKYPIAPYPKFVRKKDEETCREIYEIKPEIYNKSFPKQLVEVSEPYIWRNQRVVRFIIHPFMVENNRLITTSKCRLSINFLGNGDIKNDFTDINLERVFENTIINFNVARNWSISSKKEKPDNPFTHADRWFKIPVTQDGIYKITKSQLSNAGIDIDNLDPESIKIFNGSGLSLNRTVSANLPDLKEIPVFLSQSGNDFFIYFYARDTDGFEMNPYYNQYFNPYTGENVYWLTYNTDFVSKANKKNIKNSHTNQTKELVNTYHFTEHHEEEKIRSNSDGIAWFWYNLSAAGSITKSFVFNVSNLINNNNHIIRLKFNTTPDSDETKFYINNYEFQDINWSSTITLTGNFLNNGINTLYIEILSPTENLYFDYYEVEYDKNLSMENDRVEFSLPEINTTYEIEISNVQNNELNIFKITDFDDVDTISSENYNYNPESHTLMFIHSISNLNTKFFAVCSDGYLTPSEIIEMYEPEVYYSYNQNGQVIGEDKSCYLRDNIELANTDMIIISPESFFEMSKELASLHSELDSMTVLVAQINDVYDEFSWGLPDVVAIRYFLRYALDYYGENSEHKVAYVILAGDGTNDFRKYEATTGDKNRIPPFIIGKVASDDYYIYLDNNSSPDMMIGRLPCQNISQLNVVIDKIINYLTNPNYGFWRSRVILIADDFLKQGRHTETQHTNGAENCANVIQDNIELIKIYGVDYPLDEFQNRPEVNEDLIKSINDGAAIFYYIGHGGYDLLGDEDYFRASRDISRLNNSDKLTFFVGASCNNSQFDSNTFESMGEKLVNTKDKGAIATFAATRGVGGPDFCNGIIDSLVMGSNKSVRIGEVILKAKGGHLKYDVRFILLGDPAVRLVIPGIEGYMEISEGQADSIKARQTAHFIGEITDLDNQYNQVFSNVYDTDYKTSYPYEYQNDDDEWVWGYKECTTKGKPIFKGPISCFQDSFSLRFIVPDDIYGGSKGHILSYTVNTDNTKDILLSYHKIADHNNHNLIINGYSDAVNDGPPILNIWLDREEFQDGDYVSATPTLFAEISDSNGINMTNYPGHRILFTLDDDYEENITKEFCYNLNSFTEGKIEYKVSKVSVGTHQLKVELFDSFNERGFKEIAFKIKDPSEVKVYNVLNYPNPMEDFTYFTFYLDDDATIDIEIFTISGKLIKKIENEECSPGYNQLYWDGKDSDGDYPANGVYFYKIIQNSKRIDDIYKLIIYN